MKSGCIEGAPNQHVKREFLGWQTTEEKIIKCDQKEEGPPTRGESTKQAMADMVNGVHIPQVRNHAIC
jgi:hypothetical protein